MTTLATPSTRTIWNLDPAHTTVEFAVKHLMITTVKGRFADVRGTLELDENDPSASTVQVEIGAASIDTRNEQRDGHLRSADFFDVENHPTLVFVGKRIEGDVRGAFRLIGDLTIRGTTREIALDVENEGTARDPWGGERSAFTAKGRFSRADFGLTWNQALEAGGVMVSDEVKVSIDAQFVKA